ncbi:MAG: hypothetical protein ACHQ9S_26590 [Candidatus Binatia bacterium]
MQMLKRRIRALEQRCTAKLNAAIEHELARFTPEKQAELLHSFRAEWFDEVTGQWKS